MNQQALNRARPIKNFYDCPSSEAYSSHNDCVNALHLFSFYRLTSGIYSTILDGIVYLHGK